MIFDTGPALSGTLVNSIGFEWMLFGDAILCFLYAPMMYFLRAPPTKDERRVSYPSHVSIIILTYGIVTNKSIVINSQSLIGEDSSVRYVNYKNMEDD